ncbi:MAG: hypothetical protein LBF94_03725 [Puniceicoccales bacterium]|jgi:hypothetical protein|nr:hypothetical protein [Puniceicoccales bacterium]
MNVNTSSVPWNALKLKPYESICTTKSRDFSVILHDENANVKACIKNGQAIDRDLVVADNNHRAKLKKRTTNIENCGKEASNNKEATKNLGKGNFSAIDGENISHEKKYMECSLIRCMKNIIKRLFLRCIKILATKLAGAILGSVKNF